MNGVDAMQHTSPDKVRLVIRTWRPDDQSVALSVSDNGTGIREEPKDRIFQPFYTTKKEGLGMGLAICRSIADAHGGEIRAANNPDGGAMVELVLPLRGSEAP
jgi:signal transduction histidine kinase